MVADLHKCAAENCHKGVPRGKLMCATHWFMVPKPLRSAIYETWNRGKPRPGYITNVREAVRVVAEQG